MCNMLAIILDCETKQVQIDTAGVPSLVKVPLTKDDLSVKPIQFQHLCLQTTRTVL